MSKICRVTVRQSEGTVQLRLLTNGILVRRISAIPTSFKLLTVREWENKEWGYMWKQIVRLVTFFVARIFAPSN